MEGQPISNMAEADVENQPSDKLTQTTDGLDNRDDSKRINAVRMAGFFCWSNFTAFLSLMIGCFTPGWATVSYKEYSLWYVTTCNNFNRDFDTFQQCESISYRLIRAGSGTLHKDLIKSDFIQAETLYCIGMILSFATLVKFYGYRIKVARGISLELSLKKWIFLFICASLSAVLTLFPVGMFDGMVGRRSSQLISGIVFAGFGGSVMTFIAFFMLLHVLCLKSPSYDICMFGIFSEPVVKV